MQGKKNLLSSSYKELISFIPKQHILKQIDRYIDFNFIYKLTSTLYCKNFGRPSIDPVVFFRIQLLGYLFGISSERKLCNEIHLNIAYRWFCKLGLKDKVPHHSSLTRIRDRLGVETYKKIFLKLVKNWQKKGLVEGKVMLTDASIVPANASLNSMVERANNDPNARELKIYEKRYHDFHVGKKKEKYQIKPM